MKYFQLSTAGLQVLRYHTSRNTTLKFKTKKVEMKHFYSTVCLLLQLDFNKGKEHSVKPHLHANTQIFLLGLAATSANLLMVFILL